MNSYSLSGLFQDYLNLLYREGNFKLSKVAKNAIIPFLFFLIIFVLLDTESSIQNTLGVLLSILVGLLFNFVSTLGDKFSSTHLEQSALQKKIRLELIKETYEATFVTIFISVVTLILLLPMLIFDEIGVVKNSPRFFDFLNYTFNSISLTLLFQICVLLILMINRLKKLMDVDVNQELKYLEKIRKKETDQWEQMGD